MIKIGMLIADRYEVLEKVGTGGMSDVYKAKDHKLNRLVAVKALKQEFSENANFVSKFRVEAQAAAGLMHPNIVNVYDVGEERGLNYIVMELVDGITLKKYIEKKARLSVKEAISIAIQVAMGLEAAHYNHIIHRDIKPQNIIISKDGKVKVTDFGIAKAATSNTITSNVMGSVHYTSPEQARGGYSDEKSDIYSLGITIFEMLTGRVPFNGETTVAIAIKHIQQPMPSPCEFVPEVPHSVEQIVLKCCEKSPDRRYQSMTDLIADLKQSLIHPEDDFVKVIDPDQDGATRTATERERAEVRRRTGDTDYFYPEEEDEPEEEEEYRQYTEEFVDYYEPEDYPAEEEGNYDELYGSDYEDEEEPHYHSTEARRYRRDDYDDDYDDSPSGPRLDKLLTIFAVLAAIVIGLIVIFLAARKLGLIDGFGAEKEEQQTETAVTTVVMPGVVGKEADAVKESLLSLGPTPEITYEESAEYQEGVVMSASVEEGTSVNVGSNVVLTVSVGTNGILVPDIVDLSIAEATATLERKGFVVNKIEASSEIVDKGLIAAQNPAGETTAPSGSTITITISTGPSADGKVQVPDVRGLSEEEAMSILVENGLQLGNVTEIINEDPNMKGLVCGQSETPEAYVDKDTKINLQVSKGTGEVTYRYSADLYAPTAEEDPQYIPGTPVYVVIIAADGKKLLDTTITSFPYPANFTGIASSTGTLMMSYNNVTQDTVVTDPNTGESVTVPGMTEQKQLSRPLSFTPEQ